MNQDTDQGKPTAQTVEKQAQKELNQLESQTDSNRKAGTTNEVQPIATDEGITQ